jgi:DNA-binding XRE family transcriptional regulator
MQLNEEHVTNECWLLTPAERLAASRPARVKGPKPGVVRGPLKPPPGRKPPCWTCGVVGERRRLGLSQEEVARALGMKHVTLLQIEHGYDLMHTTARRVAEFFGKPVESLWRPPRHRPGLPARMTGSGLLPRESLRTALPTTSPMSGGRIEQSFGSSSDPPLGRPGALSRP